MSAPADDPARPAWARVCLGKTYIDMADDFDDAVSPDDIEEAITLLKAALQTPGLAPERRELAARRLGEGYNVRERGDRAANVEQAVFYLSKALELGGPPDPPERMVLLSGIGILSLERAGGIRSDNVETAIRSLTQAERLLGSLEPGLRPFFTGSVQLTLGNAYAARMQGDPSASREAALEHHRAAAAAAEPGTPDWETATSAVADDLIKRLRGDPSANLEEALSLLRQIMDVHLEHDAAGRPRCLRSDLPTGSGSPVTRPTTASSPSGATRPH